MFNWLKDLPLHIINLILYSNLWIALAAMCMCLQTNFLFSGSLSPTPFTWFVFAATLFLYAVHRIVGLEKVKVFTDRGRFEVISRFKTHILLYAFVAGSAALYFFWQLSPVLKWTIVIPSLLSLGYVLPVFSQRKRLRDISILKIFLIAIVWSLVTVLLPSMELSFSDHRAVLTTLLERASFIFAITIPFDIRDLEVDRYAGVKTIPSVLGVKRSLALSQTLLGFSALFCFLNFYQAIYDLPQLSGLLLALFLTSIIVYFSNQIQHDYYFTGLLDGAMILQFLLLLLLSF